MNGGQRLNRSRKFGPGSCSNCLRQLPIKWGTGTDSVTFTKVTADSMELLTLSVGDALNYLFKAKSQNTFFDYMQFCSKCNALLKTLLEAYAAFRSETNPESISFKFLEGDQVDWAGKDKAKTVPKVRKLKTKTEPLDPEPEERIDVYDDDDGSMEWTGESLYCNEQFEPTVEVGIKESGGRGTKLKSESISDRVNYDQCELPGKEVPSQKSTRRQPQKGGASHSDGADYVKNDGDSRCIPVKPKLVNFMFDKTYENEAEALAQIRREGNWSRYQRVKRPDGSYKVLFRCKLVPGGQRSKHQCAKRIYLLYPVDSIEVSLYRAGEDHTNHSENPLITMRMTMTVCEAEREFYTDEQGVVLLRCINCSDTFGGVKEWAQHQLDIHKTIVGWSAKANGPETIQTKGGPKIRAKYLPCPDRDCGRLLTSRDLPGHVDYAHRQKSLFRCSYCGKAFPREDSLRDHERKQHEMENKKIYLCLLCGQAYAQRASLVRHELAHKGEVPKPFQCEHCPLAFSNGRCLRKHEQTHVPPEDRPKPFTCSQCPRSFFTKQVLDAHQLVHSQNQERYKCEFCEKAYRRKPGILIHLMNIHRVTEPQARASLNMRSKCQVQVSASAQAFKPPNTCSVCSKNYTRREYLTAHLMTAHGKTEEEAKSETGLVTKKSFPFLITKPVKLKEEAQEYTIEAGLDLDLDSEAEDKDLPIPEHVMHWEDPDWTLSGTHPHVHHDL